MIPGFRFIRRDEPKPDPEYAAYLERRLAQRAVASIDRESPDFTLIGPAAGELLRELVYGPDPHHNDTEDS